MDSTIWLYVGIILVSVVVIGLVLYRGARKTKRAMTDQAAREDAVERMAAPAASTMPAAPHVPDVPVAAVDAPAPAAAQGSGALAGPGPNEVEVPLEVEVTNLKRGESGPKGA